MANRPKPPRWHRAGVRREQWIEERKQFLLRRIRDDIREVEELFVLRTDSVWSNVKHLLQKATQVYYG